MQCMIGCLTMPETSHSLLWQHSCQLYLGFMKTGAFGVIFPLPASNVIRLCSFKREE